MEKIQVNTKEKNYCIYISESFLNESHFSFSLKNKDKVVLITNSNIKKLHFKYIQSILKKAKIKFDLIILPEGEKYKILSTVNNIITELLKKKYGRDTTLIAFGGGVICDITGFVASIYQRGIDVIQIPTTFLAQIDASIGGKTGVNHTLGKNMIGTFYQPSLIMIDIHFLKSLPKKEFSSGIAEAIKYGIILDKKFFIWLEKNLELLFLLKTDVIKYCLKKCCSIKSEIVSKDEKEKNIRAYLNFGHTYGHAIESFTKYKTWLHGEAISVGMIMAAQTAVYIKIFKEKDLERIIVLLKRANLPIKGPKNMLFKDYIKYMIRDKKVFLEKLNFILPKNIGRVEIYDNIPIKILKKAITNHSTK